MITGGNLYSVAKAMAPLYAAMALGYVSVKYLRAFTPHQCAGINHFVAVHAIPILIFRLVSSNNPYAMSGRLVAADILQKLILLVILFVWAYWAEKRQKKSPRPASSSTPLQWVVTIFSLATLPNTIIIGVPLLVGMYGSISASVMVQIVLLQYCIWYNLVIFLYEYMAAKRAILAGSHQVVPTVMMIQDAAQVAMQENENDNLAETTQAQQEVFVTIIEDAEQNKSESLTSAGKKETATVIPKIAASVSTDLPDQPVPAEQPDSTVAVKVAIIMAVKKLLKMSNIHACILGLAWSFMAFKVGIKLPVIVDNCLAIISSTAVGLSMFAAGAFLARQNQAIPCGYSKAILSMLIRFIIGPILMAIASFTVGLHGTLLHIAIVQAALPLAVSCFVYAEEYNLHSDIMTTGIIIGNFLSLPFTILYNILTGL